MINSKISADLMPKMRLFFMTLIKHLGKDINLSLLHQVVKDLPMTSPDLSERLKTIQMVMRRSKAAGADLGAFSAASIDDLERLIAEDKGATQELTTLFETVILNLAAD